MYIYVKTLRLGWLEIACLAPRLQTAMRSSRSLLAPPRISKVIGTRDFRGVGMKFAFCVEVRLLALVGNTCHCVEIFFYSSPINGLQVKEWRT
jgi:hypothetical protein